MRIVVVIAVDEFVSPFVPGEIVLVGASGTELNGRHRTLSVWAHIEQFRTLDAALLRAQEVSMDDYEEEAV